MAPRRSSTSYRGTASPLRPASARPRTGRYDNLNLSQRTVGSSRRSSHASTSRTSRGRAAGGGFQGQGRANAAAAANPGARMMLVLVLMLMLHPSTDTKTQLLQPFLHGLKTSVSPEILQD